MSRNYKSVSQKIVNWYLDNARDLPWRSTKDPYIIWISEIVLQQTTVAQGTAYFKRFVKKYPTVQALAKAPIDEVLKLWEGLGYYSRARNLHFSANYICDELDGVFPTTHKEILKLKGVGPYTAAAISSFAFNLSHPVVDGNVLRFISRLFEINKAIDLTVTKNEIESICDKLIKKQEPEIFNQAIMEFGALMCTPKNPNCTKCVFKRSCLSYKNHSVSRIPFKSKKIKKKKRYFNYLFFIDADNKTLIQKRTAKDIWNGLYQFPLLECDEKSFAQSTVSVKGFVGEYEDISVSRTFKQQLTHQTIHAKFYTIYTKDIRVNEIEGEYKHVPVQKLNNYAWPKINDLYFND